MIRFVKIDPLMFTWFLFSFLVLCGSSINLPLNVTFYSITENAQSQKGKYQNSLGHLHVSNWFNNNGHIKSIILNQLCKENNISVYHTLTLLFRTILIQLLIKGPFPLVLSYGSPYQLSLPHLYHLPIFWLFVKYLLHPRSVRTLFLLKYICYFFLPVAFFLHLYWVVEVRRRDGRAEPTSLFLLFIFKVALLFFLAMFFPVLIVEEVLIIIQPLAWLMIVYQRFIGNLQFFLLAYLYLFLRFLMNCFRYDIGMAQLLQWSSFIWSYWYLFWLLFSLHSLFLCLLPFFSLTFSLEKNISFLLDMEEIFLLYLNFVH